MISLDWIKELLSEETGEPAAQISGNDSLKEMALDSLSVISLSHEIEQKIGKEIDPTALEQFETVEELAQWIETQK